jgi:hypothetical protein
VCDQITASGTHSGWMPCLWGGHDDEDKKRDDCQRPNTEGDEVIIDFGHVVMIGHETPKRVVLVPTRGS